MGTRPRSFISGNICSQFSYCHYSVYVVGLHRSQCVKLVCKGTMRYEIIDQSSLHPLIRHPGTDMAWPGIEPRPLASQALYVSDCSEPLRFAIVSLI